MCADDFVSYAATLRNLSYDAVMNSSFGLVLLLTGVALAQSSPARQDWELVRSAPNGFGGTVDFVLVPEAKQHDREHYKHGR